MATSEFSPFGLAPGAFVYDPATWDADPVRTSGFPPGLLLKEQLNTPLRQASSLATMLANFIAARQAANVLDDGDLVTLLGQFEDAILNLAQTRATNYRLVSPAGLAATRNVYLTPGTWQMVLTCHMTFVDPGNYDFMATQLFSVVGSLVNMNATATARVVRGGGSGFGRSVFPTISANNSMVVPAGGIFAMNINALTSAGFSTCQGSVLALEKIA